MRIKYSNVGSLGSGEFELSGGLNAVVGPNGSGKSTLVNALYFAFTGETINGETLDTLVTWGCPTCTVYVADADYTITRTVNAANGTSKVKFCRGDVTLTRKKEVDQAICEMFGFVELSILKLVYFAEQYRAIDFVTVTDSARTQMMSSLFGFARLDKIRSDIQSAINSISVSTVGQDVINQMTQALDQACETRDKLVSRHSELSSKIVPDTELAYLQSVIMSKPVGYRDELNRRISELTENLSSTKAELDSIPDVPGPDEAVKYNNIRRHTELSKVLVDGNTKLEELINLRQLSPDDISGFLRNAAITKNSLESKKQNLEQQLGLLKSGKCPLTKGIPCPDLQAMTDEATVYLQIGEIDSQIAQISADEAEMNREYTDAVALEAKISAAQAELSVVARELKSIVIDTDFSVSEYEERSRNAAEYDSKRTKLLSDISVYELELAKFRDELSENSGVLECEDGQRDDAQLKLDESQAASAAISELSTMIPRAESAVAEQRSSLQFATEQNELAARNQVKRDTLTAIRTALHRDNLPRLLVEDMLEALNTKLSQYLVRFSFPYEVSWTAGGSLLYTDGAEWHKASQLSGGQKYVLVISLRCALADMLSSSFPLFVLDEPTTGLDIVNRESLSQVLSSVVQTTDRYLVVPTHDDMLLPEANIISVG